MWYGWRFRVVEASTKDDLTTSQPTRVEETMGKQHFKIKTSGNQIRFVPRKKSKDDSQYALAIALHRTLRLPDDGKTYPLPPSLGRFPMKRVDDYKTKVPSEWVEHGGIFVPLFQREALWLSFHPRAWKPVAVKVAAGKVNAVSGEPWLEEMTADGDEQDYMVAPPQPWLDGFNTGKGVIRQFVAMPLGMGYTVEGQVTGEETFGGIQLLVIDPKDGKFPERDPAPSRGIMRSASLGGQHVNSTYTSGGTWKGASGQSAGPAAVYACNMPHDGMATMDFMEQDAGAAEMGLAAGGKMSQKIYPDPHGIETWDEKKSGRMFIHIVNSQMWKQITGEECPATPITAQSYAAQGLPWFDVYDEGLGDVKASKTLKKVKSVGQKDQDHGFTKQMDNTSVKVPKSQVHKQKVKKAKKLAKDEVRDGKW
jgi:hypothetical protein